MSKSINSQSHKLVTSVQCDSFLELNPQRNIKTVEPGAGTLSLPNMTLRKRDHAWPTATCCSRNSTSGSRGHPEDIAARAAQAPHVCQILIISSVPSESKASSSNLYDKATDLPRFLPPFAKAWQDQQMLTLHAPQTKLKRNIPMCLTVEPIRSTN